MSDEVIAIQILRATEIWFPKLRAYPDDRIRFFFTRSEGKTTLYNFVFEDDINENLATILINEISSADMETPEISNAVSGGERLAGVVVSEVCMRRNYLPFEGEAPGPSGFKLLEIILIDGRLIQLIHDPDHVYAEGFILRIHQNGTED